jgi:ribose 1,5-bisphosphate isomerase
MPPHPLKQTIKDIKSLKIQGAEAVSREAVKALKEAIHKSKARTPEAFISEVRKARSQLEETRPTEPYLRNSLKCVFYNARGANLRELKENLFSRIQKTLALMERSRKIITEIGSKKIKNGMVVFTHCHSSTVTSILIEAKKQGKRFSVHNTETRPRFQGRKTAKELANAGIKVRHYVDSAARLALKKADIMLIGADAITSEGKVINKIGSELFAEVAGRYDTPVYVCANSWKFDPETVFGFTEEIEERKSSEVWKNPPKNVVIDNHAFEIIGPGAISGVITELGVYEPHILVEEIKREYPWMVKK